MNKEIDCKQMSKLLEHKLILCTVKTNKKRKISQLVSDMITNMTFDCIETIPNEFNLFLTNEYLYIEAHEYEQFGGLERANNDEIIQIEDIDSFRVGEIDKEKFIKMTTVIDTKERLFICNDEKEYEMAKIMSDLILGLK